MDWREAEREYDDEVIGETTLGRMFEDAAERHRNRPAQRYKGGVYDRSLTDDVVPATPGAFGAISYAEMRSIVRTLAAGFATSASRPGTGLDSSPIPEWSGHSVISPCSVRAAS